MSLAIKNLLAERTRLALSVVGLGFAVSLMLVMAGIFVGTTRQVTTYIDHSRNAVWVMQPGFSDVQSGLLATHRGSGQAADPARKQIPRSRSWGCRPTSSTRALTQPSSSSDMTPRPGRWPVVACRRKRHRAG